ncbi:PTS transporter subunit IIC [Shouchella clausii]|uniref:PTS transporter subunit IIC n=1 Tax=Shouchella clausii TaxID=79880 RepID=UPI0031FDE8E3
MTDHIESLAKGLIGEPAIFLGLVACMGLLLARVRLMRVLSGTIKVMVGVVLLQLGASAAGVALSNLAVLVQDRFQVIGYIPHNEAVTALVQINYGREVAITVVVGVIVHLLIARFTPIKYVFLSGHHVLFMAAVGVAVVLPAQIGWWQYLLCGSVLGVSMSLSPALIQRYVKQVTGDEKVAVAHFNSVGYFLAGCLSTALFKPPKRKYLFPNMVRKLEPLMQDHLVVICAFSFLLFFTAAFFSVGTGSNDLFAGQPFFIFAVVQSLWFTAGMYSILIGVRMMVAEIVPAYEGVSAKWIKGSIPAIDAPVLFPFAPLAAIVGFLVSFSIGVLTMFAMMTFQYTIIIPGIIPHFFSSGTVGVIAFRLRGAKALFFVCAVHGLLLSLLPLLLVPYLADLGYTRTTFADTDLQLIGILLGWLIQ